MGKYRPDSRSGRGIAAVCAIVLAAQALPALAAAPILLAQADQGQTQAPSEPMPAGSTNRSIFLSLFATNFVPIVANGLANWFRNKVFGADGQGAPAQEGQAGAAAAAAPPVAAVPPAGAAPPAGAVPAADQTPAPAADAVATRGASAADGEVHAGIAYQVWLLGRDGSRTPVDPANRVFASGERFEVDYRPNFPGTIEVFNIDPVGKQERIDRLELAAAELGKLGPYEFGGEKGEEKLRIVLYPCLSSRTAGGTATSRGISKVQIRPEVTQALGGCQADAGKEAPPPVATRGISKVAREGGTSFALDPVGQGEIASGKILPREILLRFQHQ